MNYLDSFNRHRVQPHPNNYSIFQFKVFSRRTPRFLQGTRIRYREQIAQFFWECIAPDMVDSRGGYAVSYDEMSLTIIELDASNVEFFFANNRSSREPVTRIGASTPQRLSMTRGLTESRVSSPLRHVDSNARNTGPWCGTLGCSSSWMMPPVEKVPLV